MVPAHRKTALVSEILIKSDDEVKIFLSPGEYVNIGLAIQPHLRSVDNFPVWSSLSQPPGNFPGNILVKENVEFR